MIVSVKETGLARRYYPNDLMLGANYNIRTNRIGDATAFYIGWTDEFPEVLGREDWKKECVKGTSQKVPLKNCRLTVVTVLATKAYRSILQNASALPPRESNGAKMWKGRRPERAPAKDLDPTAQGHRYCTACRHTRTSSSF